MRRVLFLLIITIILIISGFLSIQLSQQSGTGRIPGVYVQTTNPDASVLLATPQKGALFVGFLLITLALLGGLSTGLAFVFWFLNRQVTVAKALPNQSFTLSPRDANANSLVGVMARYPAIPIAVLIILVLGAALTLALLGAFSPH